jgi:D-glycero-D-manno-heptose 1,7-bisphosphate phosphatase
MLLRAAAELDLDLAASWFVGDILDDVEAGNRAGCRTILVDLDTEPPPTSPIRRPHFVARDTVHALRIIHALSTPELTYRPAGWQAAGRGEPVPAAGGWHDRLR